MEKDPQPQQTTGTAAKTVKEEKQPKKKKHKKKSHHKTKKIVLPKPFKGTLAGLELHRKKNGHVYIRKVHQDDNDIPLSLLGARLVKVNDQSVTDLEITQIEHLVAETIGELTLHVMVASTFEKPLPPNSANHHDGQDVTPSSLVQQDATSSSFATTSEFNDVGDTSCNANTESASGEWNDAVVPSNISYKDQAFTPQELRQGQRAMTDAVRNNNATNDNDVPTNISYKDQAFTLQELRQGQRASPAAVNNITTATTTTPTNNNNNNNNDQTIDSLPPSVPIVHAALVPNPELLLQQDQGHIVDAEIPQTTLQTARGPTDGDDDDNDPTKQGLLPALRTRKWYCIAGAALLVPTVLVIVLLVTLVGGGGDDDGGGGQHVTLRPTMAPTLHPPLGPTAESPTSNPTTCNEFDVLQETRLPGDFIFVDVPLFFSIGIPLPRDRNVALEECKAICAIMPKCEAFTLLFDENEGNKCFVKNAVPEGTPAIGRTSGVKRPEKECPKEEESSSSSMFTIKRNIDLTGNNLVCVGDVSIKTLDAITILCRDICSVMSECKSFTAFDVLGSLLDIVSPNDYGCCIKAIVPSESESQGATSGIKK